MTEIPNLGVHTSYKKALSHYESVIADRMKRHGVSQSTFGYPTRDEVRARTERVVLVRSAFVLDTLEEVRLERWKVK
jgi:hypothetical protein